MARGSDQAKTAATSAQNFATGLQGQSGALYSTLAPQLASDVAHPPGFSPQDMAAMDTANLQEAGGAQSAAIGQGGLLAARTRNAGAPAAAVAEAGREAEQGRAKGALTTQILNAKLKQQQRSDALTGEERLYGATVGGANSALGEVAPNVNADANASQASWGWVNPVLGGIKAATDIYKARKGN